MTWDRGQAPSTLPADRASGKASGRPHLSPAVPSPLGTAEAPGVSPLAPGARL